MEDLLRLIKSEQCFAILEYNKLKFTPITDFILCNGHEIKKHLHFLNYGIYVNEDNYKEIIAYYKAIMLERYNELRILHKMSIVDDIEIEFKDSLFRIVLSEDIYDEEYLIQIDKNEFEHKYLEQLFHEDIIHRKIYSYESFINNDWNYLLSEESIKDVEYYWGVTLLTHNNGRNLRRYYPLTINGIKELCEHGRTDKYNITLSRIIK